MTLTLRIISRPQLDTGATPELVLNNRGANIGRSLTCEWVLPDESKTVSGRHCEIQFRDDAYFLIDFGSTNGTFVGQSDQRLEGAHRIEPGDHIRIGPYVIEARLAGAALHQHSDERERAAASARGPEWQAWDDVPGAPRMPAPPPPSQEFPADGGWDLGGTSQDRASIWSEDVHRGSAAPTADDIFGDFTAKNEIDWANASWSVDPEFDPFAVDGETDSGFKPLPGTENPDPAESGRFAPLPGTGQQPQSGGFAPLPHAAPPAPPPIAAPPPSGGSFAPLDPGAASDPFGSLPGMSSPMPDPGDQATVGPWGNAPPDPSGTPLAPPPQIQPPPVPIAPPPAPPAAAVPPQAIAPMPPELPRADAVFGALLGELGVPAAQVKLSPEESAAKAGRMLRHLLAGLMILVEARARAKDEMGAAGTALGFDGNNPLKFARNVDQALQMMLNPRLRGYMEAEEAIEEAFRDLQAHQIATLKAMQGALRETLNRFSPAAIKARTKQDGLLAKMLPGQREAALWKAYESQFSGVADGSAEAFLEVFSREFRKAYEESSQRRKP